MVRMNEGLKFWNTLLSRQAIVEGHFYYGDETGDRYHTEYFVDTDVFFQYPVEVIRVGEALYHKLRSKKEVDRVVTPSSRGGLLLAHHVAERFNAQVVLANRRRRVISLPADFDAKGTAVIVDDGISTGNSIRQLESLLDRAGVEILGAGVFVERYVGNLSDFFADFKAIVNVPTAYRLTDKSKQKCRLCEAYLDTIRKIEIETDEKKRAEHQSMRAKLEPRCAYGED